MTTVIIGNAIGFVASVLMVATGFIAKKKNILFVQTIQIGLQVLSNLVLKGFPGAVSNGLGFIRNIVCYKEKLNLFWKIFLTAATIIITAAFNNLGIIGFLPVISAVVYIWLMNTKNVIHFKLLIIFTSVMWMTYELNIMLYTSAVFNFMTIIANIVSIIRIKMKKPAE
jgi:hypothetical protein